MSYAERYEQTWCWVGQLLQGDPRSDLTTGNCLWDGRTSEPNHALESALLQLRLESLDNAAGTDRVLRLAQERKARLFGGKIFPIVPVYVTSICQERCLYCNYRAENKEHEIERIRLSEEELLQEVRYLVERKGLRVIELVYATDPNVRVDAMCRHVEMVRELLEQHGGGEVGMNAEAFDEYEYRRLRDAGLSFCVLWQETYDRDRYRELHPGNTKKTNFEYRLDAFDRMISAGISHIGLGVLSGLADWQQDWAMLMHHEAYLLKHYGVRPAILGIPRLKPARGAALKTTPFVPTAQELLAAVALHNIFSPQTMAFVNTREDWELCIKLACGGGCLFTFDCTTIPGGYSLGHQGYQFPVHSYDADVYGEAIKKAGLTPVFDWRFSQLFPDSQQKAGDESRARAVAG